MQSAHSAENFNISVTDLGVRGTPKIFRAQGLDFAVAARRSAINDIIGKRAHNPFRSVVPSKFRVFLACNLHYLMLKGVFLYTFVVPVFQGFDLCDTLGKRHLLYTFVVPVLQGFDLCDLHGKRPHNLFRSVVPSNFRVFLACNSHYLRLKGGILVDSFVVPVFQGFDLCDIHGKRPHNPFRSVVLSKVCVFFGL